MTTTQWLVLGVVLMLWMWWQRKKSAQDKPTNPNTIIVRPGVMVPGPTAIHYPASKLTFAYVCSFAVINGLGLVAIGIMYALMNSQIHDAYILGLLAATGIGHVLAYSLTAKALFPKGYIDRVNPVTNRPAAGVLVMVWNLFAWIVIEFIVCFPFLNDV